MTESSRARILHAAADLLARDGYNGMGLKAISQASGLPYGSIYHHFPGGKEEIATTTIDEMGALLGELVTGLFAQGVHRTSVEELFGFMADRLERSGWVDGCMIGTPALDGSSVSDAVRRSCERAFASVVDPLDRGLRVAGVPPDDARRLATTVISAYEGATILARAQRSREPLATTCAAMAALVEAALPAGHAG